MLLESTVQNRDEDVFANVRVAYQTLLAIAGSMISNERLFNKLKLI